ncbi:hypothetical protein LTR37_005241 [Vermiconidia calcicola]|uniref:Uncharacterized protein n=1 Tax=Vermiconidia calcicola TaxID=1690605 RepID=A0ACC3NL74_9PEZI|nr:hypothetical protein LTR37_005241 [Vermiconidia calcicola]
MAPSLKRSMIRQEDGDGQLQYKRKAKQSIRPTQREIDLARQSKLRARRSSSERKVLRGPGRKTKRGRKRHSHDDLEEVYFDVPISIHSKIAKAGSEKVQGWTQPLEQGDNADVISNANFTAKSDSLGSDARREKYNAIVVKHWGKIWFKYFRPGARPPFDKNNRTGIK